MDDLSPEFFKGLKPAELWGCVLEGKNHAEQEVAIEATLKLKEIFNA